MLLVGLFAPGEQCSAAGALGMLYYFILAVSTTHHPPPTALYRWLGHARLPPTTFHLASCDPCLTGWCGCMLQHQADFDVVWVRGTTGEMIFKPWVK